MKKLLLATTVLAFLFSSCEKDNVNSDEITDESVATELSATDIIVNEDITIEDALETTDYEVDYFTGSTENLASTFEETDAMQIRSGKTSRHRLRYLMGIAPSVSIDTADAGYPIIITLDYGDGTELLNGKIIKGQIIITLTAPPKTDGAEKKVELSDFYVDSTGIEGTSIHIFNFGPDSTTIKQTYNRTLTINFYNGSSVQRTERKVREWISGWRTPADFSDNEIHITGITTSTGIDGTQYQREIIEPLVKLGTCRAIVSGIVEFSIDGEVTRTLDYGDGTCDAIASVEKDGESKRIRIGKWWHK